MAEAGAAGGDRTHDPWLRRPILYPLSYSRAVSSIGGRARIPGFSHPVHVSAAVVRLVAAIYSIIFRFAKYC